MNTRRRFIPFLAVLALAGCQGERPFGIQVGDLGGIWVASVYQFTENGGSNVVDLVARDGANLTLSIDNTENPPLVTATFDPGSGTGPGWFDGGTVNVVDAELTIGAGVFRIVHDGNQMTLTNPDAVYTWSPGRTTTSTLYIELTRL